ncbi:MAG: RagB/SusD family nutrient uptake outer membrane protein [Prevotella sp.]|nr:RagB/SusD family nutrient uptake outer membrane protein [Prevotella sp.]
MKIKNILSLAAAAVVLASCADKMDYKEYSVYDEDFIKTTFNRSAGIVTSVYNDLDYDFGNYSGAMLASATDEAVYSHAGNAIEKFYDGGWSATSNNDASLWTKCWRGISYANLFLDKYKDETFEEYLTDLDYKAELHQYQNLQYEARFLRAYYYFLLVRSFGGVPLITNYMEAEEANTQPRVSSDEIFQFINSECVAIQDTIVKDYSNLGNLQLQSKNETGRVNNLCVLALKARAALYYASPLFNTSSDKARWQQAAQANKELIDECRNRGMKLSKDYGSLFQKDNWQNSEECILVRRISSASNTFEQYNFPIGLENAGGGNCPTQNLVDAYEPGDIRLEATVAQNGELWPNDTLETFVGGANGQPIAYATPTGYYLKKYVNKSLTIGALNATTERHHWVIFRLAEFYLNYAEAMLNYTGNAYETASGLNMTAAAALNTVRTRAGLPNIATDLSAQQFEERLENERFVELAFEGHRFYDLRRWKKAGDQKYRTIKSMRITKNADGTFTYTPQTDSQTRSYWDDKMLLFPIAQSEILKSGNALTQNPGW